MSGIIRSTNRGVYFKPPPPEELPLFNVRSRVPLPSGLPSSEKKNHVKVMNQNVNNKKVSFTPEISMTEPFNLRALATSTDNLHHPLHDCQKKITALFRASYNVIFFYVHVTVHRNKSLCNKTN